MKQPLTIGIVGGTSPESTVSYYRHIVRKHQTEFKDHSYPRILICSVSFQQYIDWQHAGDWNSVARGLEKEMQSLAAAGADFALLAANTMHKVLPQLIRPIPILSILDVVSASVKERGIHRVGLVGTKFTMSRGFYVEELEKRGLAVVLPVPADQDVIHKIIFEELIAGKVLPASVEAFARIVSNLSSRDADAVFLGCTELDMLADQVKPGCLFIDSAKVHAEAAWSVAMSGDRRNKLLC